MKKNLIVCLSIAFLLNILYILIAHLQMYIQNNPQTLPFSVFVSHHVTNMEFYVVPIMAGIYFLFLILKLRNTTKLQLLIIGNALIFFLIGLLVDRFFLHVANIQFYGVSAHFVFIKYIVSTASLHIVLSFFVHRFKKYYQLRID